MAFSYNKKNLANTTITGAITSSDTSITVDDATVFPSGYFYATLMPSSEMSTFSNSEIVLVTNISSNTLTIARAQKNTTAKAFSAGAIITNGVYTEDLDFAQSVGKKIFSAAWGGQESPYYKITDDMLKVVPDEGTSIRAIFDTDYASGTANLSINESSSGVATVSGSNISITDAENLAPLDVKLKGDTEQFTTTGKNKFDLRKWHNNARRNNVSNTNIDDSGNGFWITYTAGVDAFIGWAYRSGTITNTADIASLIPAKPNMNYTISVSGTGSGSGTNTLGNSSYVTYVDSSYNVLNTSYIGLSYANAAVFETPANTAYILFRLGVNGRPDTRFNFENIQLEEGRAKTSFEPYTGGAASPRPDYPQAIQTVTGEQTITISDGENQTSSYTIDLGQNFWSDLGGTYSRTLGSCVCVTKSNGHITMNGTSSGSNNWTLDSAIAVSSGMVVSLEAGTYTMFTDNTTIQKQIIWTNSSGSSEGLLVDSTNSGVSFTLTETKLVYVRARVLANTAYSEDISVEIQKGTTQRTPIELCKLGDYQDYIYKSGSDWYIHKETGSITANGSENWTVGGYVNRVALNQTGSVIGSADNNPVMSNRYIAEYSNTDKRVFLGASVSAGGQINVNDSVNATSVATWTTYLSTNPTTFYFALATATDTQITDATLISQLNALANATLYAGTNNIVVTGGLDGILEVQYYRAGSGVNLVPIVNGAYVADDNTRNVAPVKAGIPYDLTYHSGNWYVMNMIPTITSDDIDFTAYSTTEQVVGTWIDGKPLYRRVWDKNTASTNETWIADIPNIMPIRMEGYIYNETSSICQPIGQWTDPTNTNFSSRLLCDATSFKAQLGPGWVRTTYAKIRAILWYTKTTDTAQQTRSVPDSETDDKKGGEEEPEEPIEEQQNR